MREYFEQRILQIEAKVDESTEKLEKHIEVEVGKVGDDVEKVCQMQSHLKSMVGNLSDKVDQIEGAKHDFLVEGYICFVTWYRKILHLLRLMKKIEMNLKT